jgi:hypothetical protein
MTELIAGAGLDRETVTREFVARMAAPTQSRRKVGA